MGDTITTASRPSHVPEDRVVDFDFYNPPGVAQGLFEAWKTLQQPGVPEIVWTPHNGGHWIATRGKLVQDIFRDYQRFSSRIIIIPKERGRDHQLLPITVDPPAHRPYRTLLTAVLGPQAVKRVAESIRTSAAALIEGFRMAGRCDFVADYSEMLPLRVFMDMVDLPITDAPRVKYLSDQITRPDGSMGMAEAIGGFTDYLMPFVLERQAHPGEDMLSQMINGRIGDRKLTAEEAVELSIPMLAGLDTVISFFGFVMLFLARNPEHRRQIAADPALIPGAVDEFIRRFPLASIGRYVTADMVYAGVALKEGDMILLPTALHGLDDQIHDAPMNVDFHREDVQHSTFGHGSHICPGAHLTRVELRITLEEWLARIPDFDVSDERLVMRSGIVGCVQSVPLRWDPASTHELGVA